MNEEILLKHVRSDLVQAFPREFGLNRSKVMSRKHYLTLCSFCSKFKVCGYVSVYSEYEYKNNLASCLYFDVDGEDVLDTSRFVNTFLQLFGKYKPMVVYTGGRGYHIFVPLPPIVIGDLKSASKYFLELETGLEYEKYVDVHSIGNWRAICRIPYTPHRKTGLNSLVVRIGSITENNCELALQLIEKFTNKTINTNKIKLDSTTLIALEDMKESPPCISKMLNDLITSGELSHFGRMQLTVFLLLNGFNDEELHQIFQQASDYNYQKTNYQIQYLKGRRMKMFSCYKLIEYNLCPFPLQHCKYYPSLNWYYW